MKSTILRALFLTILLWVQANAETEQFDVGTLIDRVIAGEDFSGQELIISGVALNETTSADRLVNVGTRATYQSGAYLNFVSVYDTNVTINEGSNVQIRVLVETSIANTVGGKPTVIIETAFRECLSCKN